MSEAKDIHLAPIAGPVAVTFVRQHHYSHTTTRNTQLHLGVFLGKRLEGVMQFGPSTDKKRMLGLVSGTGMDNFCELNRMVFTDRLPRNSESRAIAVAMRLLRQHYPSLKWVVSFADGTQCGDGTIYRASGFLLTQVKPNKSLYRGRDGRVWHALSLETSPTTPRVELGGRSYFDITGGRFSRALLRANTGAQLIPGFQLRYVYFLDPSWRPRLTVPVLPYDVIDTLGARMYRGATLPPKPRERGTARPARHEGAAMRPGGSTPTHGVGVA